MLKNFHLNSKSIQNVIAPDILVAGCGTGQHSIGTASRFSDCQVTAVDLSLASLAYAQRKSNELRFTNIDYLQADILHLQQMGKEFDIIESAGVLHHMDEPMAGWRVLVDLLKPGGLMKIGLYSGMARHHIVEVRKEITELRVGTSEADIRKFRQSLAESNDKNHQLLTKSSDFFSLSMLRDLIFHVQEHRFTQPQIQKETIKIAEDRISNVVKDGDIDPIETKEWIDSLSSVLETDGSKRAQFLIKQLIEHSYRQGSDLVLSRNTPYVNTISPDKETKSPGDQNIERRIRSLIRWNAAAMVVRANKKFPELGGHIGTFASAATL